MAGSDTPLGSGALPDPNLSEPPDIMNDEVFNPPPPARQDTLSKASEDGSEKVDTCRICRSEGTIDEPLFYPCKCSGSIKFVHQECLMEWLSHSHKKHCELCKTPFRFTKLYDANMPQTLPWTVFVRRACWHVVLMIVKACRTTLVAFVWLGLIPWLIRWVWRWLFWIVDAAWAREAFMEEVQRVTLQQDKSNNPDGILSSFQQFFTSKRIGNATGKPLALRFFNTVFRNLVYESVNSTTSTNTFSWPQADPSIVSSWSYLSNLTPSTMINRAILDVFEGQLITCVIIVGFILVFLIREWVVQQQPMMNLENLGNMQDQLREAAARVQADNERLRRQEELLDQARRRLIELQTETEVYTRDAAEADGQGLTEKIDFVGWDSLEHLIDHATNHLKKGGGEEHVHFLSCADNVTKQIRAAGFAGINLDEFTDKVFRKLATLSDEERKEWEAVLVSEIDKHASTKATEIGRSGSLGEERLEERLREIRRPTMPDREFSSRATQIQRLLADAEDVFNNNGEAIQTTAEMRNIIAEVSADDASVVSHPSTESWQQVTPPSDTDTVDQKDSQEDKGFYPLPITNAGPDAKVNIRRTGKGKMKAVPPPKIEEKMLNDDEELNQLEGEVAKESVEEKGTSEDSSAPAPDIPRHRSVPTAHENNPFHPDGPAPERRNSDSFGNRVASVFREEFGLDEADELESLPQARPGPDGETAENDVQSAQPPPRQPNDAPPGLLQRALDWFWGDIKVPEAPEPVPPPNEERQEDVAEGENAPQVAPFAPVQNNPPAVAVEAGAANPAQAEPGQPQQHDPEVVAAAQQAGLDPEAVEDAEDLEGILELIGLQGPLVGLIQTSAFCLLLVSCTILGAVIVPYFGGKMVLSLAGRPSYFLIKLPLQAASFIADFFIDLTLMLGGWMIALLTLAADFTLSAVQPWIPSLADVTLIEKITEYATAAASNAAARLSELFVTEASLEELGWKWAFLGWSVHAHASLRTIQDETNAVLSYAGTTVTRVVETVSSGNVFAACKQSVATLLPVSSIPAKAMAVAKMLRDLLQPFIDFFTDLSRGALKFSTPEVAMDPSLVYWDSTDRSLAILAGYTALAAVAAVYVAFDTPFTKSEAGRKAEKIIRDSLRQAGGVLKVILIISIEMLVFPLYCGLLLDIAFLPLFRDASVASRWEFAGRRPYMFCFVHWFVGTCYMFHFALFVGMCRKILRKGVLWFIRDPDDPTFHPVRDVLERNVSTQLRKIAFSALVYGALVILCLGGVIWSIGRVFKDIFPIYWISTEPILEFPLDLLLYNFVTPLVIRLFKPSDVVNAMYGWWLRRCARSLRLSHFLFDDRRKDEEGRLLYKSWSSFFSWKTLNNEETTRSEENKLTEKNDEISEDGTRFERNGKYVLTPCNDQYRPPKPGEAFLYVDDNDVYIADKDGKKNDHFSKVYLPPWFRLRIAAFMVCLWIFSAFAGLCVTLVPLVFGRHLIAKMVPESVRVNDIYAYSLGSYFLGGAALAALKSKKAACYLREKAATLDLKAWIEPLKHFVVKLLKCAYVYGFLGVVLPTLFALLLQFYLILPLHTWSVSSKAMAAARQQTTNSTLSANGTNIIPLLSSHALESQQSEMPTMAEHTFHILQDYALGLLYVRIASRIILVAPASRAAEAFRRITADGYLNPNIRLATRFFVLPVSLLSAFVLLFPLALAGLAVGSLHAFGSDLLTSAEAQTKVYRYSCPAAASCVMLVLGTVQLGKATSRWRARIRDEVYLVGERLHNFGEKKPPIGSKSVVRKER